MSDASHVFKDIITKTAKFKEFTGPGNKFQNSRGFKEIKDTWLGTLIYYGSKVSIRVTDARFESDRLLIFMADVIINTVIVFIITI